MKTITHQYVKPEDMNHHGSLYANTMTDWLMRSAFFGVVEVLGRQDHVVMVGVTDLHFIRPVSLGTILEIRYGLTKVGTSSLTIAVEALDKFDADKKYAACQVTFVNTDENGKSAPHGIPKSKENMNGMKLS